MGGSPIQSPADPDSDEARIVHFIKSVVPAIDNPQMIGDTPGSSLGNLLGSLPP